MSDLKAISMFTGIGGLDCGLEKAGLSFELCIESDPVRCNVLGLNRPRWKVISEDIRNISPTTILRRARTRKGEVDLMSGGPPCQPFSKAAFWVPDRFRPYRRDERRSLLRDFARVVIGCRPKAFVLENVAGLAFSTNRLYLDIFRRKMERSSYKLSLKVLNAVDYGVPQRRERLFVIGSREGVKFEFPLPTHRRSSHAKNQRRLKETVTAGRAIGHLDDKVVHISEKIGGKWGHLLPHIPPGQNYLYFTRERGHHNPLFEWRSKYWSFLAKLSPKEPSWTIPSSPGPYTGPFHWRNRRLRIPEVTRLQTFPVGWHMPTDSVQARKALGDATPPHLAYAVGKSVVSQLLE